MRNTEPQSRNSRHERRPRMFWSPLAASILAVSACGLNDPAPATTAPAPAAPAAPAATATPAPTEAGGPAEDRTAAREQRRIERREQRKVDFDSQMKAFEYGVLEATADAEKLRAKVLEIVQPVAGVPLQWTIRSCVAETIWDSADGTLKGQGAILLSQSSLETETCQTAARSRSSLIAAQLTTDTTVARATHQKLVGLTAESPQTKVSVESTTTAAGGDPVLVVRAQERHRGVLSEIDTTTGLGKVVAEHFWASGTATPLASVCGQSRTVRQWVLEEQEALPARESASAKAGKQGKARKTRERHRSWARLAVTSNAAGTGAPLASLHMREASKRETDAARLELATTTYNGLKAAGMVSGVSLIDAQYRCGA